MEAKTDQVAQNNQNSPNLSQTKQANICNLEVQLGQLEGVVKENAIVKLPSNTEVNPKEQVQAVTLRSVKKLQEVEKTNKDENEDKEDDEL